MSSLSGPLRRRSLVAGMWTIFQNVYSSLAGIVTLVVLTNLIAPAEFGVVSLAMVFITIMSMVSDLGVSKALIRATAPTPIQLNSAFWSSLGLGFVLGGLLEISAGPIAAAYSQPALAPILQVVALALPLRALYSIPTALLSRELRMRPIAFRQTLASTVGAVGAIILAFQGFGAWALVFQECGTDLLEVVVLWTAARWRPQFRFSPRESWTLIKFGVPTLFTQFAQQGRDRGTELLIAGLLGTPALGVWVVATKITGTASSMISSVLNAVALPTFALVRSEPERLVRAARHSERISASIAVPGFAALAFVSPLAVPTLFGADWHLAGAIGGVNAIWAGIAALQVIDTQLWWALGRPLIELWLSIAIAIGQLAAVAIGVHWGLLAVAIALVIRTLLLSPLRLITLVRVGRIPLSIYSDLPRIVMSVAAMLAAMYAISIPSSHLSPWPQLLIEAATAIVVYLGVGALVQRRAFQELATDIGHLLHRNTA